MNLKNNKGYVGVDVTIAVIILLILVPTIMGIVYNINISTNATEIKTAALNIAVNSIEAAKSTTLSNNETFKQNVLAKIASIYNSASNKEPGEDVVINTQSGEASIFLTNASYVVKIEVSDYSDDKQDNNIQTNIVKTVKATVTYKIRNNEESIDLSTVIK